MTVNYSYFLVISYLFQVVFSSGEDSGCIPWSHLIRVPPSDEDLYPLPDLDPWSDVMGYFFSSGTTGPPKVVETRHCTIMEGFMVARWVIPHTNTTPSASDHDIELSETAVAKCWSIVFDAGPTWSKHWVNVPCLLGDRRNLKIWSYYIIILPLLQLRIRWSCSGEHHHLPAFLTHIWSWSLTGHSIQRPHCHHHVTVLPGRVYQSHHWMEGRII